jgi:hypothetical protein
MNIDHTHKGTIYFSCSFITLREPCNNQQPGCDIAWLHVTNIYTTVFRVKRLNSEKRGINITYIIYDVKTS